MSGGSSFLPFLSLINRQHLIHLKSSLLVNLALDSLDQGHNSRKVMAWLL